MTREYVHWDDDRIERLKKLKSQKLTWMQIAERLGMTEQQVRGASQRYGLTKGKTPKTWTEAEDKELSDGVDIGMTFPEIAATLPGRTAKSCCSRYHRLHPAPDDNEFEEAMAENYQEPSPPRRFSFERDAA